MSKQCSYDVLGLQRNASPEEVKGAYRKLAKEHHPDRNPDNHAAEHKFKELSEAYEILKDPNRRAAYDRFGHAAFENGAGRGPQGSQETLPGTRISASLPAQASSSVISRS